MSHQDKIIGQQVPWEQPISADSIQKILKMCAIGPETISPNFHILDFGCGNGRYLELFATWFPKQNLYGTEVIKERVIQVSRKGFKVLLLNPQQNYLTFKSASFDIVFSSNVIEHIPRSLYLDYLRDIHRVLKPGGRFVVGTPNYPIKRLYDMRLALTTQFTKYYLFDDPTHCNKLSIFQLEKDLSKVFKVVYLEPTRLFLQEKSAWLREPKVRQMLKGFGNKVIGYCIK